MRWSLSSLFLGAAIVLPGHHANHFRTVRKSPLRMPSPAVMNRIPVLDLEDAWVRSIRLGMPGNC